MSQQDELEPYELWNIRFYPPQGNSGPNDDDYWFWNKCALVSRDPGGLTFLDEEGKLVILSGGAFFAEQMAASPEESEVITPAQPQLTIIGGR